MLYQLANQNFANLSLWNHNWSDKWNETTLMQTWIFEEENNVTNASELNKIKDLILIIIQSMLASWLHID